MGGDWQPVGHPKDVGGGSGLATSKGGTKGPDQHQSAPWLCAHKVVHFIAPSSLTKLFGSIRGSCTSVVDCRTCAPSPASHHGHHRSKKEAPELIQPENEQILLLFRSFLPLIFSFDKRNRVFCFLHAESKEKEEEDSLDTPAVPCVYCVRVCEWAAPFVWFILPLVSFFKFLAPFDPARHHQQPAAKFWHLLTLCDPPSTKGTWYTCSVTADP